jgi:hypothetical protein
VNDATLKIYVEEIARIALEDEGIRSYIGHELDLSEKELVSVLEILNSLLEE